MWEIEKESIDSLMSNVCRNLVIWSQPLSYISDTSKIVAYTSTDRWPQLNYHVSYSKCTKLVNIQTQHKLACVNCGSRNLISALLGNFSVLIISRLFRHEHEIWFITDAKFSLSQNKLFYTKGFFIMDRFLIKKSTHRKIFGQN